MKKSIITETRFIFTALTVLSDWGRVIRSSAYAVEVVSRLHDAEGEHP